MGEKTSDSNQVILDHLVASYNPYGYGEPLLLPLTSYWEDIYIVLVAEWLERTVAVLEVSGSSPGRGGHKNLC